MDQKHNNIFNLCNKKAHLLLMEGATKQIEGNSHLDQHYCDLKYIVLARITEYTVVRLVTIEVLHFTGDKVKAPAVRLFVSSLRCLYKCLN